MLLDILVFVAAVIVMTIVLDIRRRIKKGLTLRRGFDFYDRFMVVSMAAILIATFVLQSSEQTLFHNIVAYWVIGGLVIGVTTLVMLLALLRPIRRNP